MKMKRRTNLTGLESFHLRERHQISGRSGRHQVPRTFIQCHYSEYLGRHHVGEDDMADSYMPSQNKHYDYDEEEVEDTKHCQSEYMIVTVTPVRNLTLTSRTSSR